MEAVLVRAVRLGKTRLDRDVLRRAVLDHLTAARELSTEFLQSPRSDHRDFRIQRFSGQLETALVVALARCAVHEVLGTDFLGNAQARARDDRTGNRRTQEVNALVLRLPLNHREREIAAALVFDIHDASGLRPDFQRFFDDRFLVFARLTDIDVHRVYLKALVHQPAQKHRRVKSAGVRQYAGFLFFHVRTFHS